MLNNLKLLVGIEAADTDRDNLLNLLLANATARLKRLLDGTEPPEDMQDIIIEVAVKRFNRIGSEGLESHSVEGESLTFKDDDFSEFSEDIAAFLAKQKDKTRGKLRFL